MRKFLNPGKLSAYFSYSFYLLAGLLISSSSFASNIEVTGNVGGTWDTDTVIVRGNITLTWSQTLTIKKGCNVLFAGPYYFLVSGQLDARGDADHRILFSALDTTGFSLPGYNASWRGIAINSADSKPAVFEYCTFQYAQGFQTIRAQGKAILTNCNFFYNRSSHVCYLESKSASVSRCVFSKNTVETVLTLNPYSWPAGPMVVKYNTIVNNKGIGLHAFANTENNVFELTNNILWNNTSELVYHEQSNGWGEKSQLLLRNCIIRDQNAAGYNSTCSSVYPAFADTAALDFRPQWGNYPQEGPLKSIAIDNGDYLEPFDADGSRSDIGAISFIAMDRVGNSTARFTADTTAGYRSTLAVRFSNTSYEGNNPAWYWDFGDGNTSTEKSPAHTYTQSGTFSVSLKVQDQNGHRDSVVVRNQINILPGTKVAPGNVSGRWEKRYSPYYVYGTITVPQQQRLDIEPGTQVLFMGSHEMIVRGAIHAVGTPQDTIAFLAYDTTGLTIDYKTMVNVDLQVLPMPYRVGGWVGLHVDKQKSDLDSVVFSYCKFSHVRSGNINVGRVGYGTLTLTKTNHAWVSNSYFTNNISNTLWTWGGDSLRGSGAGVALVQSNARIYNNKFENIYADLAGAVTTHYIDSAFIYGNEFVNIKNTVTLWHTRHYIVDSNYFHHNANTQILSWNGFDYFGYRTAFSHISRNVFQNIMGGILGAGSQDKLIISHNKFLDNWGPDWMSCVQVSNGDSIYIINNLFANNGSGLRLGNLGGVCINLNLDRSRVGYIANNTMVNNLGSIYQAAGLYADDDVKVYNNISRNASSPEWYAVKWTTSWNFSTFKDARNNNTKGGYAGPGNIDLPAQFLDSLNQDFRLASTSPNINKGYTDLRFLPGLDLAGQARVDTMDGVVDIGAFEFPQVNYPPTGLALSRDSVRENMPAGTFIGRFSTQDQNTADRHRYEFVNSAGSSNDKFSITTDSLLSKEVFTYGSQNTYPIRVKATDKTGAAIEKEFLVYVTPNRTTGIVQVGTLPDGVSVGPNPFRDYLYVNNNSHEPIEVSLFDANGRHLFSKQYKKGVHLVEPKTLPAGVYYLFVASQKRYYSIKISKL